ncbi:MAG: hypothetical protein C4B57_07780, partial [Deltaproteobacteria bacterium]
MNVEISVPEVVEIFKEIQEHWIFHISAGEFCDAAQEALLSLQRQAVIVFSQAMGKNTTIAR